MTRLRFLKLFRNIELNVLKYLCRYKNVLLKKKIIALNE